MFSISAMYRLVALKITVVSLHSLATEGLLKLVLIYFIYFFKDYTHYIHFGFHSI